ncbi:MAG: ATP-binding cassette domain-containing protein [Anaerotruncus sp.]|nr:ATP-binding cassette domain-containing protein [Anaerotruncus sp.]
MGIAIRLKEVSFKYDGAKENVLENINLTVEYGETVLLSGVSGEGKSTLLSIINGVIPFVNSGEFSGSVEIDGKDVTRLKISERSKLIGTVLQNADEQIIYDLVNEEIAFGCENLNIASEEIDRRIERFTTLMQIEKTAKTKTLSGGQKQRLITASTLAMEQKIIILDEPLANLDTHTAHILLKALRNLANSGYAVLIVEHRLDVVKNYIDKVMRIENKQLFTSTDINDLNSGIKTIPHADGSLPGEVLIKGEKLFFAAGDRNIIDGLDIEIRAGERIVLLGENGCGKTTLMRMLARLNKPSGGVLSQTITKSKKANSKWFSKVGYVYQNPTYQLFMPTLLSEISFKAKSEETAREMINAFGLSGLEQRHPQSLSEGQKRRASIAAVCASEPTVLFLDEPTVGQDYENLCKTVETVNKINKNLGTAIVTVTHDKRCAGALADRVLIMKNGKISRQGDYRLANEFLDK